MSVALLPGSLQMNYYWAVPDYPPGHHPPAEMAAGRIVLLAGSLAHMTKSVCSPQAGGCKGHFLFQSLDLHCLICLGLRVKVGVTEGRGTGERSLSTAMKPMGGACGPMLLGKAQMTVSPKCLFYVPMASASIRVCWTQGN